MNVFNLISILCLTILSVNAGKRDPMQTYGANRAAPTQPYGPLPTHFGLFMYSLDGTIVNETLYARSQPCVKNVTTGISTVQHDPKYDTYGSYTWGIGPHGHLFAYHDGRIATCSPSCTVSRTVFGGTSQVIAQTWQTYYSQTVLPSIPTCGISRNLCTGTFFLECESEGQDLIWSFCGSQAGAYGQNYTLNILSWSTIVAPGCIEVKIHVVDEPKNWGNQTYNHTSIYKNCTHFLGQ